MARIIRPTKSIKQRVYGARDDGYQFFVRRDFSAGQNTRQNPNIIAENEAQTLTNCNLEIPGQTSRIPGLTLIEDLGNNAGVGAFAFYPQGGTANLFVVEGANLKRWSGSGSFSSVTITLTSDLVSTFTKAYKTSTGDVCLLGNGTDNWQQIDQAYTVTNLGSTSGTGSDSPPKSKVGTFFRDRLWILRQEQLFFSSASPSDYSTAFDTVTDWYRIQVGEERALLGTRDLGLIIAGSEQIWALDPSTTPSATDRPSKLLDFGVVSGKTFCQVGDDYLFLATDGVRALKRTIQDKLQIGSSEPLSYKLKDEFTSINWQYISKSCAVYWQNKYFIALPTTGSTYNNTVWVYYPASNGWSVVSGWNVGAWTTFKVNGEERLYFVDSNDGKVYRAWYGATNNSSSIPLTIEGRQEDYGKPLEKKVGAELKVVAKPSGDYDISVEVAFDGGSYNSVGTMNIAGSLITFPTTFPVNFYPDAVVYKKFHLDSYGPFYNMTYKLSNDEITSNSDDITIYEVSSTAFMDEYISEEEV